MVKNALVNVEKEMVVVGDNRILVKRTADGALVSGRAEMWLYEEKGEIYKIGYGNNVQWEKTAKGINKMNQVSGVSDIKVDSQTINGMLCGNPYAEKENGVIARWYVTVMLFGYTPMGTAQIISNSLCLDLGLYWIESLSAKIKDVPAAGKVGDGDMEKPYQNTAKYCIDSRGQIFMYVNIDHPDIIYLRKQDLQRQKTGDRMAFTICRNNALKRSASMVVDKLKVEKVPGTNFHKALVKPWYFKNVNTVQEMQQMCKKVVEGDPDPKVDTVIIDTDAKEIRPEDIEQAEVSVVEQGDNVASSPPSTATKKAAPEKKAAPAVKKEEKKAPETKKKEEKVSDDKKEAGDMKKEKLVALGEIAKDRVELKKNLGTCKNDKQREIIEGKLAELDTEEAMVKDMC